MKYLAIIVFAVCMIGFCASESQAQCYRGGGYYGGHYGGHYGGRYGGHYGRHYYNRPAVSFSYSSYPRYNGYYGGGYGHRPYYGHGYGRGHVRYGNYGYRSGWSIGIGF